MDKRFFQIVDELTGTHVRVVPADDVFECLFWMFSLYSCEIASDEVVDACKRVADGLQHGNYGNSFYEDCTFLNITAFAEFSPYVDTDSNAYYYATLLNGTNGRIWDDYRREMRTFYRMANGELIAC